MLCVQPPVSTVVDAAVVADQLPSHVSASSGVAVLPPLLPPPVLLPVAIRAAPAVVGPAMSLALRAPPVVPSVHDRLLGDVGDSGFGTVGSITWSAGSLRDGNELETVRVQGRREAGSLVEQGEYLGC